MLARLVLNSWPQVFQPPQPLKVLGLQVWATAPGHLASFQIICRDEVLLYCPGQSQIPGLKQSSSLSLPKCGITGVSHHTQPCQCFRCVYTEANFWRSLLCHFCWHHYKFCCFSFRFLLFCLLFRDRVWLCCSGWSPTPSLRHPQPPQ